MRFEPGMNAALDAFWVFKLRCNSAEHMQVLRERDSPKFTRALLLSPAYSLQAQVSDNLLLHLTLRVVFD